MHDQLVTRAGTGKHSTAFEFMKPNPDFWRISFPPDDWAARSQEPKKTPDNKLAFLTHYINSLIIKQIEYILEASRSVVSIAPAQ